MKKLGTIICIALMLTVGGVYATFNYAQTTAGSVEETVGHTIEGAVTNTAKGTIGLTSDYAISSIEIIIKNILTQRSHIAGVVFFNKKAPPFRRFNNMKINRRCGFSQRDF